MSGSFCRRAASACLSLKFAFACSTRRLRIRNSDLAETAVPYAQRGRVR